MHRQDPRPSRIVLALVAAVLAALLATPPAHAGEGDAPRPVDPAAAPPPAAPPTSETIGAPEPVVELEELGRLGIPTLPDAYRTARASARRDGAYFETFHARTSARRADLDGDGRAEIAVLYDASWLCAPDGFGGSVRSLIVFRDAEVRWVPAWRAPIHGASDGIAFEVVHLDDDARPELVVDHRHGGSGGGGTLQVFEHEDGRWHTDGVAYARDVEIDDLDGDGIAEVIAERRLETTSAAPSNASRVFFPEVLAWRDGRLVSAGAEHRDHYRTRLLAVEDRLASLATGRETIGASALAAHVMRHEDYYGTVWAELAYRLRRVIAGRAPFDDE